MLQDVESGRDPEIDALVGAVIELGNRVGVPVPHIEAVYAMVKLLGRTMKEEKLYIKGHPIP
jgi:2-dehydropantoate 2-reductase